MPGISCGSSPVHYGHIIDVLLPEECEFTSYRESRVGGFCFPRTVEVCVVFSVIQIWRRVSPVEFIGAVWRCRGDRRKHLVVIRYCRAARVYRGCGLGDCAGGGNIGILFIDSSEIDDRTALERKHIGLDGIGIAGLGECLGDGISILRDPVRFIICIKLRGGCRIFDVGGDIYLQCPSCRRYVLVGDKDGRAVAELGHSYRVFPASGPDGCRGTSHFRLFAFRDCEHESGLVAVASCQLAPAVVRGGAFPFVGRDIGRDRDEYGFLPLGEVVCEVSVGYFECPRLHPGLIYPTARQGKGRHGGDEEGCLYGFHLHIVLLGCCLLTQMSATGCRNQFAVLAP